MTIPSGRRFALELAAVWLLATLLYLWTHRADIAVQAFPDPDDAMRLQQVRDWLAGQSWFDVGQHRMNAPWGAPMHWSRLVDLPIAGMILLARLFVSPAAAETIATAIVPSLTMLCVMLALGFASRRLLLGCQALLAAGLVPVTVAAVQQLQPLRIDHHGWQIALAALMLLGLVDGRARRGGMIVGVASALWLAVSIESLPMAAGAGGWLALRWLMDPEPQAPRLRGYVDALAGGALLLFVALHSPTAWLSVVCDQLAVVHIAAIVVAGLGVTASIGVARTFRARLIGLGVTALAAAAVYRLGAPQCGIDAFSGMDPLVRHYWYSNVIEGLPVWRLEPGLAITGLAFPIIGLIGTALAWRAATGDARARWLDALALLTLSLGVAILVQRAATVAQILALPGSVFLLFRAVALAQALPLALVRVPATVLAALACLPLTPALLVAATRPIAEVVADRSACATAPDYRTARALRPGVLLTDIDIGPGLLVNTNHGVVASGHHRNQAGLHDVIATFVGTPDEAHAIFRRRGVAYLVVCRDLNEMSLYAKGAPHGFWAQLRQGRVPAWLRPVRIMNSDLSVWQVVG